MSTPPRDAGIPMLTEVIDDADMEPGVAPGTAEPPLLLERHFDEADAAPAAVAAPDAQAMPAPEPMPAPAAPVPQPPAEPAYPLPLKPAATAPAMPAPPRPAPTELAPRAEALAAPINDEEWQRMERRVRERILGQLMSRTDAMLEERIRASLGGVIEQAIEGLAASLRLSLHKTLEDVVSRAVAQEITRLQSSKK